MNTVQPKKRTNKGTRPPLVTKGTERLLRTIHFYRFMNARHVAALLYSPSSLTYVRSLLSELAGGTDFKTHQYLYRFPLPNTSTGNTQKVYTLGSRGRDFLSRELGLPVEWYFRPYKCKYLSYSQVLHSLSLSGWLVAAKTWATRERNFRIAQLRICYELALSPATVEITQEGKTEQIKVIPDGWILFEKLTGGAHECFIPVLLELDRGTEHGRRFRDHVRSRIAFIQSGAYSKMFDTKAVIVAYATTGQTPEYRETRRRAMCVWTNEVLKELNKESWASIFRLCSLLPEELYTTPMFDEPVWYRPDSPTPVPLFAP